ncbi:uncharacterized protein Dwil_GK12992 [Drosophila willistoni]|uniref:Transmembrane protein 199 n=1 Tax=Drosophila willistoni TaxID=7260 RepID=B4NHT9_DROWI|nr:uncharacterized protein LOC6650934 [Drosophila willistoni]EDW84699.1 uncharacterized protein Dwil_GK12992 [Drosophila willistoni]
MLKSTIIDNRVRIRPSKKVLDFLANQKEHFTQVTDNVAKLMKTNGYDLPENIVILKDDGEIIARPKIDNVLLKKLIGDVPDPVIKKGKSHKQNEKPKQEEDGVDVEEDELKPVKGHFLYLKDCHWLNNTLSDLRKRKICEIFLYELIESSELILPENELKPRNPELEKRCQRLREEQHNREYHKMTKSVDAGLKYYPEDTISYQIKSLNKQIIAVAQFIFSVAAGFTFGFFGVNLMVGPLPFGFRILLGVMAALVIALAEMYFLAKKLHEYDEVLDAPKRKKEERPRTAASTSRVEALKPHSD